ncbi:MAG: universal stress protein [Myxococcota bacterium]
MRLRKILAYVDSPTHDDPSVTRACQLAMATGARVTVANVIPKDVAHTPLDWRLDGHVRRLGEHAKYLRRRGINAEIRIAVGPPATELTRMVLKQEHDLVTKTARPNHQSPGGHFGATAHALLTLCPCPVWIAGANDRPRLRKVLAVVHPWSPDDGEATHALFDVARQVAEYDGAELHIARSFSTPKKGSAAATARAELRKLGSTAGAAQCWPHLLDGPLEQSIPTIAERLDADLVVMQTPAEAGTDEFRAPKGSRETNRGAAILRRVPKAVLALKAPNFEVPALQDPAGPTIDPVVPDADHT